MFEPIEAIKLSIYGINGQSAENHHILYELSYCINLIDPISQFLFIFNTFRQPIKIHL